MSRSATTRFPKSITSPPTVAGSSGLRVLKSGKHNKKLGARLEKGRWKGKPIFALTLTERATCWPGCQNWDRCYGDSMPFATRYETGPALTEAIDADLQVLSTKHPYGFVVRLHVLGDFYSTEYVAFWRQALERFPALTIWGYTHWRFYSPIGRAVTKLVQDFPERVSILRSDPTEVNDPLPGATTIVHGQLPAAGSVTCPEQVGRTRGCFSCGLCMTGRNAVSFVDHSRKARALAQALQRPALPVLSGANE